MTSLKIPITNIATMHAECNSQFNAIRTFTRTLYKNKRTEFPENFMKTMAK